MNCFICDLDGTLCGTAHRKHWVTTEPKNWNAFFGGIPNDSPIEAVMRAVEAISDMYPIFLVSGRPEKYRAETVDWLERYSLDMYDALHMRKDGDNRPDDIVKSEIADQIIAQGYNILGVFDDRPRVISMWRARGIFVFDVNQTGEDF